MLSGSKAIRSRKVPELDELRGLALLLILVWHYLVNDYATGREESGSPVLRFATVRSLRTVK